MKRLFGFMAVLVALFLSGSAFVQGKEYKVGKTGPSGGFIFFDKGAFINGWRYLEAAPVDEVNGSVFSNVYEGIGITKTGIGEGKANTKAIISQAGHKESAAKLCDDLEVVYNGKTFSDYFLPSKDELYRMYEKLHKSGVSGFSNSFYWSSSEAEYNENYAWYQDFYYGYQYNYGKDYGYYVRCARAF